MIEVTRAGKTRHLVLHDYGTGGVWWWVWAASAQEIVTTFAQVEVVTDLVAISRAIAWSLDETDLEAMPSDPSLAILRAKRDEQRGQRGFAALVGKDRVYLREQGNSDSGGAYFLTEVGPDGRSRRQVAVGSDGDLFKRDAGEASFNPPYDLYDPQLAAMQVDRSDFEEAWGRARHDTEDQL